jgi:ADP-ribose pyrophosphatase
MIITTSEYSTYTLDIATVPEPVRLYQREVTTAPSYPSRFPVPAHLERWDREFSEYRPPFYESPRVLAQDCTKVEGGWADPSVVTAAELREWSQSGRMSSFEGPIQHDPLTGRPLNPLGRTGICGRGLLGKWGPNHAADSIVTRISPDTGQLEVLLIQRRDGAWALPGGMRDAGERGVDTAVRELTEETGLQLSHLPRTLVYQGMADGPRLTDNAWIETEAFHVHISCKQDLDNETLRAGDDALDVRWAAVTTTLLTSLYANHSQLIVTALEQARPYLGIEQQRQIDSLPHVPLLTNLSQLKGRIALCGASADCITHAHKKILRAAIDQNNLDSGLFIPTPQNPLKAWQPHATAQERIEMSCHEFVYDRDIFVSPIEIRRSGNGYTIDTVRRILEEVDPATTKLYWIMGTDGLATLSSWKEIHELVKLIEIIPVERAATDTFSKLRKASGMHTVQTYFGATTEHEQLPDLSEFSLVDNHSAQGASANRPDTDLDWEYMTLQNYDKITTSMMEEIQPRFRDNVTLRESLRSSFGQSFLDMLDRNLLENVYEPISSSEVRSRLETGDDISGNVDRAVERYIRRRKIYTAHE